jgi:hypothetical protein
MRARKKTRAPDGPSLPTRRELRDRFAQAALAGLAGQLSHGERFPEVLAERCWEAADAMLTTRRK